MKKTVWTILGGIGFFLLLAGASAMDSESLVIPAFMAIAGVILCSLSARVIMPEK